ncbi:MAG: bacillithiol biosynthesis deacetylase BshB1 [Balneolaceae bacterium]|nr:bacillithiol biosynthesis deacetylase BshB1 [Balneolaceae bacterium]
MTSLDILAFAAHPDDTELCCGGTLAKACRQGLAVGVVDFTRGEMATRGTPEQRMKEAEKAAGITGLSLRENLGLPDTAFENSPQNREKIIRIVRATRPHVCLAGAPEDRHPDHGRATRMVLDALFLAGLTKMETREADGETQERWRPSHVLHYMQDRPFEPDLVVDISDTFEVKREALLAFETQFNVSDQDGDPGSYISSERFFKGVEARARHYGHLIGVTYGEPFKYHNGPVALDSLTPFMEISSER